MEEFGFDFGESEAPRPAAEVAPAVAPQHVAAPGEQPGETDEDLWSEVSLRDRASDLLEPPSASAAPAPAWPGGALELEGEAAGADETVFEEVSTARLAVPIEPAAEPPAAPAPSAAPAEAAVVAAAASQAAPAVAVDQAGVERLVAAQVEEAVRRALAPLVGEMARGVVEAIAWEVIPELAEAMIRAEIERIRQSARTD
jgi:hypothetical protein